MPASVPKPTKYLVHLRHMSYIPSLNIHVRCDKDAILRVVEVVNVNSTNKIQISMAI